LKRKQNVSRMSYVASGATGIENEEDEEAQSA
jgi:hypothetical protein